MNLNTGFTTYQFAVEVITPVHVGMAEEKHYMPGLDFLQQGQRLSFLNPDALFKALSPEDLSKVTADMAAGKFDDLNRYLLNKPVSKESGVLIREETIDTLGRSIQKIRRANQTGLGQPALPGTSLKGALRSVLLWHLTQGKFGLPDKWSEADEQLFGKITANLMRYLQMSDVPFQQQDLKVYPMKVFSGDGNPKQGNTEGKWKHGNPGNHEPEFEPIHLKTNSRAGFINFYESLKPAQSRSQLRISIGNNLQDEWLDFARKVPNYPNLIEKLITGEKLIDLIRRHTAQYLEKEQAYYGKFRNDNLGEISARLSALERHNNDQNSCLLRVGANVGFHSITGDWQDISMKHYEAWVENHRVKLNNRKPMFYDERQPTTDHIFAKTRKFSVKSVDGGYNFMLPGFIKLTLQPTEAGKVDSRQQTRQRVADFGQMLKDTEDEKLAAIQRQLEEKERKLLAAKTPNFLGHTPKPKTEEIFGVVLAAGPPVKLKLYITEAYMPEKMVRYAQDAKVGDVVIITANDVSIKKGEVQEVTFKRIKTE